MSSLSIKIKSIAEMIVFIKKENKQINMEMAIELNGNIGGLMDNKKPIAAKVPIKRVILIFLKTHCKTSKCCIPSMCSSN
ncbi:MAG: hypothetical protein C5B45_05610 [Chlamydiae bacterium]|nr:MAG: hypothetical protein C5B45_05610 [Chlamydiota bacterium]